MSVEWQLTDVGPRMNDLYCREADNTHDDREGTEGKRRKKTPDLALAQLQFSEQRKRYYEDYAFVSVYHALCLVDATHSRCRSRHSCTSRF
jgi:hypothetical protein